MTGTQVATQTPNALVTTELADLMGEHLSGGLSDMKREDYAIPFIKIIQALSPEKTKGHAKWIKGAEEGDFVNSLTGELTKGDAGLQVVRVAFEKKWLEWRPRKTGGGLVAISDTELEAKQRKIPDIGNPDTDTTIEETAQIYALVYSETAGWTQAVLPWSRTKLKESRRWNGLVAEQTTKRWGIPTPRPGVLPAWGVIYHLTTKMETNKAGQPYSAPKVEPVGPTPIDVFRAALSFREIILAGMVKVDFNKIKDDDVEIASRDDVPGADDIEKPY